jgi:hypothetical protein
MSQLDGDRRHINLNAIANRIHKSAIYASDKAWAKTSSFRAVMHQACAIKLGAILTPSLIALQSQECSERRSHFL